MAFSPTSRRVLAALALTSAIVLPRAATPAGGGSTGSPAADAFGDDTFLINTSVAPNVILLMDNSQSMNQIEWHPDFDPDADPASYGCAHYDNSLTYTFTSDAVENHCGSGNRTIYAPNDPTYWDGRYLNWYFGLDKINDAATLNEIATAKANVEGCTQAGGAKFFDDKYRRTRFEASKQVLLDLLCVAESKNVRFGLATFRDEDDPANEDPNGAKIVADLGRSNPNHAAELEAEIKNNVTISTDGTPLGESLFQIYSFWMSRDIADLPSDDQNGDSVSTTFPPCYYDKFGAWQASNSNKWLEDPILYQCEKAFVIIVTDGLPTRDDFDREPTSTSQGFDDYADLIGDYYAPTDPSTGLPNDPDSPEVPGDADESGFYLDDIAKYMYDNDFRPDLPDDQTIDTYAVGFAADASTNAFLQRTAQLGNGLAYQVKDGDQLAFALIDALNDIIEKSASFTAATVPSARTTDGADFYQSYFFPRSKSAFWEGHIRAWTIDAGGAILDKNGLCALDDPTPGECNSGPFRADAEYFWDAAAQVPQPGTSNGAGVRRLYVSNSATAGALPPPFDTTLDAADLTLVPFASPGDPSPNTNAARYTINGSTAINEEGLADEIVAFVRGCFFGTGVTTADVATPQACLARPARLGDIFHSNPVVVRNPDLALTDPSYRAFKSYYADRPRVLYTGTNGGFLEAIDAGTWDASAERYTAGSGAERFGFMPWQARTNIKNLPVDSATSRTHYVDGDPSAADAWFYPTPTTATRNSDGSEWHTVLVGSLREGGHHYYSLDVTNPDGRTGAGGTAAIPYPAYLWEFPNEADAAGDMDWTGETWARPIMTRIKVRVGADTNNGAGYSRHVAIVTGGYDQESDPNPDTVTGKGYTYAAAGTHGRAIWILDTKTGKVIAEKRYDPLATDDQAYMKYSIVGSPAVFDLNFDGFADVIYFVDMGGQVFKWVITSLGDDRANDGSGVRTQSITNWPFKRFFTADVGTISGEDFYKNFFFAPAGALVSGKLWIAFGSGERRNLEFPGIAGEDENNRFYVIKDPDPLESSLVPIPTLDETDLTSIDGDEDGATFSNYGYYFRGVDGEKFVTNVEIFAGYVLAASFLPSAPGVDPCVTRGNGTLYAFDITNGKGFFTDGSGNPTRAVSIGAGLPTDPKVSVGVGGSSNKVIIEKSGADIEIIDQADIDLTGGLLYWRER
jgi:type IV pilus assembly protein PilY1